MKGRKLFAVYLLLAFTTVCFISAPVFADHPWEIDSGDDQSNNDANGPDRNDKGASIISTGFRSSSGIEWNLRIVFSREWLIPDIPFCCSPMYRQGSQKDRIDIKRSLQVWDKKLCR